MTKIHFHFLYLFTFILSLASTSCFSADLSLKEFSLRQKMPTCPPGFESEKSKNNSIICYFSKTTIANEPVKMIRLELYDEKILSVMYFFLDETSMKNKRVFNALREKFGQPLIDNYDKAIWARGTDALQVSGESVALIDRNAAARTQRQSGQKDKKDL